MRRGFHEWSELPSSDIHRAKEIHSSHSREGFFSSKIAIIIRALLFILLCKAFLKFYFLVKHDGFVFTHHNRSI